MEVSAPRKRLRVRIALSGLCLSAAVFSFFLFFSFLMRSSPAGRRSAGFDQPSVDHRFFFPSVLAKPTNEAAGRCDGGGAQTQRHVAAKLTELMDL